MTNKHTVESVWSQARNPQPADLWQQYQEVKHQGLKVPAVKRLRDRLFRLNQKLALKVAHQASRSCQEPIEDLQQIAAEGLIKAIDRFDPAQGVAFSSFAVPYIKGEIGHFLRDHWSHLKIPRRSVEFVQKVQRIEKLMSKSGRTDVTAEAIAVSILLKGKRVVTSELMTQAKVKWQQISKEVDRAALVALEDALHHAASEPEPDDAAIAHALYHKELPKLPDPQRTYLIESIFGHLSEEAIASSQGASVETVRSLIHQGLQKLRDGVEQAKRG